MRYSGDNLTCAPTNVGETWTFANFLAFVFRVFLMFSRILITGGAGFIGSHLADELLDKGYKVRVLDALVDQVHGPGQKRPEYLSADVELVVGDVRDKDLVRKALRDVDAVFHFAAAVGVGQSMYQISGYSDANCVGTAALMEILSEKRVARLIVASSMSVYGEGLYRDSAGKIYDSAERKLEQLKRRQWELLSPDGEQLEPIPTPEGKVPSTPSVYALSKYYQERLCIGTGPAYGMPTIGLRFFNVYGTRQALSNPYTGVLAIFASRILNNRPPLVHEDGKQKRDFVYVKDVALACRLALESPDSSGAVFNVGSGNCYSIAQLAQDMARVVGRPEMQPEITGTYRVGDIRHCFADISRSRRLLDFKPRYSLEAGLADMHGWLEKQSAEDFAFEASQELVRRGLSA
jgi:dTDP-L-rhamnose 4-epimerase